MSESQPSAAPPRAGLPDPIMTLTPEKLTADLWAQMDLSTDRIAEIRKGHEKWPRWCFAPYTKWVPKGGFSQLMQSLQVGNLSSLPTWIQLQTPASTVIPWRYTKRIYRFDPDLYRELVATPMKGEIPVDVVQRIPEWTLYIEMQDEDEVQGFFVSLDVSPMNPSQSELRFVFLTKKGSYTTIPVPLAKGTIEESLQSLVQDAESFGAGKDFLTELSADFDVMCKPLVEKAVSLLLYICSDEPDIRDRDAPDWGPNFPRAKFVRGKEKLFAADRVRTVEVGSEIGAQLREADSDTSDPSAPTGRTVRSHLRRGHWHGFWTGPRKVNTDRQKFILKWLPPIFVNGRGS